MSWNNGEWTETSRGWTMLTKWGPWGTCYLPQWGIHLHPGTQTDFPMVRCVEGNPKKGTYPILTSALTQGHRYLGWAGQNDKPPPSYYCSQLCQSSKGPWPIKMQILLGYYPTQWENLGRNKWRMQVSVQSWHGKKRECVLMVPKCGPPVQQQDTTGYIGRHSSSKMASCIGNLQKEMEPALLTN